MNSPFSRKSSETLALANAVVAVLLAALLTLVPSLAFGTFWRMAGILIVADLVIYLAMKLGLLKRWRERQ